MSTRQPVPKSGIVYQATVTREDNKRKETYIGLTALTTTQVVLEMIPKETLPPSATIYGNSKTNKSNLRLNGRLLRNVNPTAQGADHAIYASERNTT